MADEVIKAGDVVRVKSGGPKMTVGDVDDHHGTPTAWCEWFDGKEAKKATFSLVVLAKDDGTVFI